MSKPLQSWRELLEHLLLIIANTVDDLSSGPYMYQLGAGFFALLMAPVFVAISAALGLVLVIQKLEESESDG